MIRSYWRKAHLALALTASLFLIVTSVTGVILSFEPVSNRLHESHIGNADNGSLGSLISKLESTYLEVIEIKVDDNQLLQVSVIDDEGEFQTFHANPTTGKEVVSAYTENGLFSFSRTLHRSLFYGTLGRLVIGITAFLLFFIALSGCILVAKRQMGLKKFFSKVQKDNFDTYSHIVVGRWTLPLLLIIAFTGTMLSLARFEFFPEEKEIKHAIDFDSMTDTPQFEKETFELFQSTQLSEVEWVQFPFSPDIEDYFHIRLSDRELIINQFNGGIISEQQIDSSSQFQALMFNLHTGRTSAVWSIILGIASLSILFFLITGRRIILKRRRRKTSGKNCYSKDACSIILLVGSEGGETAARARSVFDQLLAQNCKVYIDELKNYQVYERMEHLLIFTSTYGDGQAPSNAYLFPEKLKAIHQPQKFTHSIVGFGSKNYRQFCQFAKDVNIILQSKSEQKLPLVTINDQSTVDLNAWGENWSRSMNLSPILFDKSVPKTTKEETVMFFVTGNTADNPDPESSFQLTLTSSDANYQSGDLLAIKPKTDNLERLYSIGKNRAGDLFLSIKLHEYGACSKWLSLLTRGDVILGKIQENKQFHLPQSRSKIICIANGTGIAPFIGMANENVHKTRFDLYWGGRTYEDLNKYHDEISHAQSIGQLASFQFALSREKPNDFNYVQDLIEHDQHTIAESLSNGAVLMICGSIAMRNDLLNVLRSICEKHLSKSLDYFEENGQIKIDCY